MTPTCGFCRFFRRDRPLATLGVCRSRPPTAMLIGYKEGTPQVGTYWPQVPDTESCGDWHGRTATGVTIDLEHLDVAEVEGTA